MIIARILIGLSIISVWACSSKTVKSYKSNISMVDGKFVIDTMAILNNNNLQSFITELENSDLSESKTVDEIAPFIKSFLDSLTNNFSIANPGEEWQIGCTITPEKTQKKIYDKKTGDTLIEIAFDKLVLLPSRQLIYFGVSEDIALMTYYTGGIGKSEHILIIKFNDNKIVDFWCGNIMADATNKVEIIKFINNSKEKHWGLNTNIIYI